MALKSFLGNLIRTPSTVTTLIRNVRKQEAFINKFIVPILHEAENSNDGTLESADFKKITHYYGLAVPAILGESLAVLRQQPLTERERFALTYLGAITGLFDDFFDKFYLADETIKVLIEHPEQLEGQTSAEKLFLLFYKKALETVHDRELVLHYFRKVYEAQVESKKQAKPGMTRDEILYITIHKGGVSVLFYRAALSNPFLANEEEGLYQAGGLMQFGNDVYDIFKDRNGGIHTLLTTTKDINEVRKLFREQMKRAAMSVQQIPYTSAGIRGFLRLLSLYLCSRCFVFFDQLEKKQKETGNEFKPEEYSRQDLVCDMEKNINKWRTIRYHLSDVLPYPDKLS